MRTFKLFIFTMVLVLGVASIANAQKAKPWEVPGKYKTMKNAVKADDASIKAGKDLYTKNCASCHGKTGLGDGPKARGLDTFPGNFTENTFQAQTDGDLFYKIKTGREDMPKYDGKIEDESIWQMINFMRTLKK
jgi:mono/diheme cytochrome c family protein